VAILPLTGVQVEIEIANKRAAFVFIIPNTEDLDIRMPRDIILAVF
jgi:hypothetical protein